ncbi:type II CAAX prenyl endopeptidase Rce1 family protein [Chloroflexota bacterium]
MGRWGLPYVAFLFAVLHLIQHSALVLVFVFGVGLFFGWVVNKTGSLFGVTLSHSIANSVLYLVAPFFI